MLVISEPMLGMPVGAPLLRASRLHPLELRGHLARSRLPLLVPVATRVRDARGWAALDTLVDPAMGTGTFLLEVVRAIGATVAEDLGEGAVPAAVAAALWRLIGVELQLGPLAVTQLRLLAELAALGANADQVKRSPRPATPHGRPTGVTSACVWSLHTNRHRCGGRRRSCSMTTRGNAILCVACQRPPRPSCPRPIRTCRSTRLS